MKPPRKIIITGGAGFIGSHIVDLVINNGDEAVVVDNFVAGKIERINKKATVVVADIRDTETLIEIFNGASAVFHLAALPSVQYSIDNPTESSSVNINGTASVLEAARLAKVERVIFSSSAAIYGNQDKKVLDEALPPNPLSPYAAHKLCGEELCKQYSLHYGIKTVALRYFNVYGPRLDVDGAYALAIGNFIKQKQNNIPLTITGDGKQTRDFIHVLDIARANLLALESNKIKGGEVINIGSGNNYSINELASLFNHKIEYINPRVEPKDSLSDITRARELLSFEPTVKLKDGINMLQEEWNIKTH